MKPIKLLLKQFHIASDGLLSKKEEISFFLKLTNFLSQKAEKGFVYACIDGIFINDDVLVD